MKPQTKQSQMTVDQSKQKIDQSKAKTDQSKLKNEQSKGKIEISKVQTNQSKYQKNDASKVKALEIGVKRPLIDDSIDSENDAAKFKQFLSDKGLKFENIPLAQRKILKDDILSTAVQNLTELSKIPKEWMQALKNTNKQALSLKNLLTQQKSQELKKDIRIIEGTKWNCQMYYSNFRRLWPCTLKIYPENCRYIQCSYKKIKVEEKKKDDGKNDRREEKKEEVEASDEIIVEYYDFVKICIVDGMYQGRSAYDTLVKQHGLKVEHEDNKTSPYNSLKMKTNKFERIFVFYEDNYSQSVKMNISLGEQSLQKFMTAIQKLMKILSQQDEALYGHMAEIKEVVKPNGSQIEFAQILNKQKDKASKSKGPNLQQAFNPKTVEAILQRNIYLAKHYLVEIDEDIEVHSDEDEQPEDNRMKLQLELRFSNNESSIPLRINIDATKEDFWLKFERNFHKITIKPMDYNLIKIYLTDKDINNYSISNISEIEKIMGEFYQCKLKANATKNFLKWVEKQKKKLNEDLKRIEEDEQPELENQYQEYLDGEEHKNEDPREIRQAIKNLEIDMAELKEQSREKYQKFEELKNISQSNNNRTKQAMEMDELRAKMKVELELEEFIEKKSYQLMAKDNNEMLNPLMHIYDLIALQDLDLMIRSVNRIKVRNKGKNKRGGKKNTEKKRRAQSQQPRQSVKTDHTHNARGDRHDALSQRSFKSTKTAQPRQEKGLIHPSKIHPVKKNHKVSNIYKKGSRANWDLSHQKYVKGIRGVKKDMIQKMNDYDRNMAAIEEYLSDDDNMEDYYDTPGGETTVGGQTTKVGETGLAKLFGFTNDGQTTGKKQMKRSAFDYEFDHNDVQNQYNLSKQQTKQALQNAKDSILEDPLKRGKTGIRRASFMGDQDSQIMEKNKKAKDFKVSEVDPEKRIHRDRDCICQLF